ncbi:MAG TPA: hypothetical protein VHO46_03625 [Bacteroidales bacterium]|nr:hypothetical protein [Bacteroidales bacterium]
MNKKIEISRILIALATKKGITTRLTESKINTIAETLSNLKTANRQTVKDYIGFGDTIIKEAIDFSDTDQLIDMIVDIINND